MKKVIMFLLMCNLFSACSGKLVRVKSYEREYYADDKMFFNPLPAKTEQENHVFLIREASAGGGSSFQGGCGCR